MIESILAPRIGEAKSKDSSAENEANPDDNLLEHEIECPRCHDSMTLCSDFDRLHYTCESCDFCLFTLKKN